MTKSNDNDRSIKRCRVCSDIASAFNFNGLSCESCKAFFRRHAQRLERLICHNQNKCKVDFENRRNCKRCRLRMCFDIGMQKDLLSSKQRINSKVNQQTSYNKLSKESSNINEGTQDSTVLPINFVMRLYEQNCIEIVKKLPGIFNEKPRNAPKVVGYAHHRSLVFNAQEFFIKGFIEFGHLLTPFHNLSKHDQLIVLKQSFPEIMMLRTGFYYVFEKDAFRCRIDQECNEVVLVDLKLFYGDKMKHLIEKHRKMAQLIRDQLEFDTVIRDFLSLLLMFKAKDNITNPEFLRYNYCKYCHLLRNYLEVKYQDSVKVSYSYAKMMKIIDQVCRLKIVLFEIYNLLDTFAVSQTLMEIYEVCY